MDLHADALDRLERYRPDDAGQRELRDAVLTLLRSRPHALRRTCRPDHVTASAFVTDAAVTQVLLVLHGKVRRWLQPGGHCEEVDATLAAAALREAQEETGVTDLVVDPVPLDLDVHPAPCQPDRAGSHLDVRFWAVAPDWAVPVCSDESDDVRWFGVDALPPDVGTDVVRALEAARARAL